MRAVLVALACAAALQDSASKVEQEVAYANDPEKLNFQVQAIKRLKDRGAEAVPALLAFVEKRGVNALSLGCTELFGDIPDSRLAALCAKLVEDKNFYWRPAATRALADQKSSAHRDLLRRGLADRLWGVRAAAALGLGALDDRDSTEALRKALNDETYDVRAQAAKTLFGFGDESGLPVLVASLRSEAEWFDIDYGQIAREDACNFLKKITKDDFGFKAWEPVDKRAPGLKRWEEWIAARIPDWKDRVPSRARPVADAAEYAFGFELRSCRSGDYFFRIDSKNNFVVGYFNLARAALTAEERSAFDRQLDAVKGVDRSAPYGRGGCDFEQYYLASGPGKFEKLWIGLGGRPPEMDGFIRHCSGLIQAKFGAAEAAEFKERTVPFRGAD
ncbi:MAG TPA: HEAT repeat domain-containing protein [Planctomycetota bacterium]|nr:HEAT repeat domain-containing protein [Planctomycetota bacterium]